MQNPKISIVIPTFNRAHLIKKAIESVLSQTFEDFEIIIVDDGSTDNTSEIINNLQDERINYIKLEKNSGSCAARNKGIKISKGEWIAFLDSDDFWLPTKLEKQVNFIPKLSNDYAVIHCGIQLIDESTNKLLGERIIKDNTESDIINNPEELVPSTCTMLIRKTALSEVGYFDERLPAHQETELGLRLSLKYKFKLVDEFLVKAVMNHEQITSNSNNRIKAKEIIIEKHQKVLGKNLLYHFAIIIAGNAIINKNYSKAKKYFLKAFQFIPYNIKPLVIFLLLSIYPNLIRKFFYNKYKKQGII